ncbi:MAG: response regulator, partial [Pseudobutyrivibrio sp.]|nr:response regulator [Pseudobutyrivibrio sp.]
ISRRFAELMGGNLWCESVYGEGSEFILTLNQKIVDETPIGLFREHDDSEGKGAYIPQFIAPDADILVVDDNPMNLSVIKGLLKATKVFVTTSSSGEDALGKLKDNHFNVVLLDHMMPGMDGIETVGHIREFAPDIPVYALTANSTAGEEFYISKGFNGYLSKPVDTEVLEKTILRHLPDSMVERFSREEAAEELKELPENMLWINETEGISVEDGIKNSGGIGGFISALELFFDTIDSNTKVIMDAYEEGNIRLYTIKVHALKSSLRIIGALELSAVAAALEDAGNKNDLDYINGYNDQLIKEYNSFKEKLKALKGVVSDDEGKEPISEDELRDAYEALKEMIPQMDYDAVQMIVDGLMEYKLPEEDAARIYDLSKLLKVFDWDGMEEWLKQ